MPPDWSAIFTACPSRSSCWAATGCSLPGPFPGPIRCSCSFAWAAGWRISGQVGLLSALGSACWFTGFATAPVALVRVVGQIEVAFTLGFGHFYLGERIARSEIMGLLLVGGGVIMALASAL
ncbi:Permease [Sphingomonas paucimobilis]|nr:Permease [Sphingomonas paucimobilis]